MESEQVPCPNCGRGVTPAHLAKWAGVCEFCKRSFITGHQRWIEGGANQEADEHLKFAHHNTERIFTDTGETDDAIDFDFDSVEKALGEFKSEPEQVQQMTADVLARVFAFCWAPGGNNSLPQTPLIKFTAVIAGLRPDLLENKTGRQIATGLGCTKQNLSKAMLRAEMVLGIKFSRSRSLEARQHMREKQIGHPPTNTGRKSKDSYPG